MKFFMVAPYYITWHYTRGTAELCRNLVTFIKFEFDFFSVKELFLTLFSPFQRLQETYGRNVLDFENIASALVVNVVMRVIGFLIRVFILGIAFFTIILSMLAFPILVLAWLFLPLIFLALLIGSLWAYLKYKP